MGGGRKEGGSGEEGKEEGEGGGRKRGREQGGGSREGGRKEGGGGRRMEAMRRGRRGRTSEALPTHLLPSDVALPVWPRPECVEVPRSPRIVPSRQPRNDIKPTVMKYQAYSRDWY